MICSANQWTGSYMITTSVMKELIKKRYIRFFYGFVIDCFDFRPSSSGILPFCCKLLIFSFTNFTYKGHHLKISPWLAFKNILEYFFQNILHAKIWSVKYCTNIHQFRCIKMIILINKIAIFRLTRKYLEI